MLKFKREGQVAFTESDNGDILIRDAKLAEDASKDGHSVIREDKEKKEDE